MNSAPQPWHRTEWPWSSTGMVSPRPQVGHDPENRMDPDMVEVTRFPDFRQKCEEIGAALQLGQGRLLPFKVAMSIV